MSNLRYWTAIVLGVIVGVVSCICLFSAGKAAVLGVPGVVLVGYSITAAIVHFIWWRGLGVVVLTTLSGIGIGGFSLIGNLCGSGNLLAGFIGLVLLFLCTIFLLCCIGMGVLLMLLLSAISFPFYLFSLRNEIY